jgi:hypothetical protein
MFFKILQRYAEEEVTFEALKKVLAEPAESRREAEYEKRQVICEKFRNTPFQQLVASSSKVTNYLSTLLYICEFNIVIE